MRPLAAAMIMLASCAPDPSTPAPAVAGLPAEVPEDGFERMPPPRPGDWLHSFQEEGQTLGEYVEDCANRRSPGRSTIYLQPFGELRGTYRQTVEKMREYCEIFFGVTCQVRAAIPLPDNCLILPRRQYNATMLIGVLEEHLPEDALALAGITDQDLFSKGLNYVFGEGSLRGRRGVYSLHRFEHDPDRFLQRALKLLTHELGHVLSIQHCVRWKCVMSGANSLAEGDRYPVHACPEDLRKLEWNLGFDRRTRYERLERFYAREGMTTEAAWVRDRLAAAAVAP